MSDAGYCKNFRTTLSGKAMAWFNQLPIHTIENFEQLSQRFLHHFSINKRYPKTASYLFTIVQQEHEGLRDYVQWFSEAVLEVPHLNHELLASILQQGLRRVRFRESIAGGREEPESSRRKEKGRENLPTAGVIGVVTGGPAGGDSARARKELIRAASSEINNCKELTIAGRPEEEITFSPTDLKRLPPHNDALVISATVSNFWVKKVLVDTGSAADILFFTAFSQMGIGVDMLTKVNTPLVGFNGSVVEPLGEIALPISIGTAPMRATRMIKFLVVDAPLSYNIIMGRPSLNSFRAVASTYHMKLKFSAYRGIGEEKGDRRIARECHANILKKKSPSPVERRTQISSQEEKRLEESRNHSLPPLEQHEQQMKGN
ncbi:UNVERIFIED_CONTAM: hypothetical protein Sradi_7210600 [Sesamum radiatum]|uniref:Retrotransposon gag domain-containing protein n=1 Tax=Sesamum radiatum TaxID=300843 RepID=A0AAW2IQF4_SESRA